MDAHTSPPISLIFISFSISTICCSSAKANAHGTPKSSALVLTTHSVLPPNKSPDLIQPAVVSTLLEIYDRVVGGIMSRSASIRSAIVSSSGTLSSSSVEISESEYDIRTGDHSLWAVGQTGISVVIIVVLLGPSLLCLEGLILNFY